jgi:hypothetical protein
MRATGDGRQDAARLLLAEFEFLDQRAITLEVAALEIVEQTTTLTYHLEEAAPAVMVLLVGLEVVGEGRDTRREERDLDLRGARVAIVLGVLGDDGLFVFSSDCHVNHLPYRSIREPSSGLAARNRVDGRRVE